jgi:lipocalin
METCFQLQLFLENQNRSVALLQSDCFTWPVLDLYFLFQYMGEWYELQRYQQVNQGNGECVTANYTFLPDTQRVHISNVMTILPEKETREIVGSGRLPHPNAYPLPGQFLVQFPGSIAGGI